MNPVDLVIQILEPFIVEIVVFILGHIELTQMIENQPFKVRENKTSLLKGCKEPSPLV